MWANHDAGVLWDKRNSDRGLRSDFPPVWLGSIDEKEFGVVCDRVINKYFKHPLYYTIDGKPVFSIYECSNFIKGLGGVPQARKAIEMFRERLVDLLKHYYVIGGMPEAVSAYVETRNFIDAIEVQKAILSGYRKDFAKHAPKNDVPRVNLFWDAIPSQLAKENKKFMYSGIKKGERSSSYRSPISWLSGAGLIYLVTVPRLPIKSYVDAAFKVYVLDVGLLSSMSGLDSRVVLDGSRVFTEFKGALTEQYIHQQMIAEYGDEPCYWSTDDSRTEVDFIVQKGMDVAPVEVKAEENVQSKSLKSYMERFKPPVSYRLSMLPYKEQRIASPGNPERLLVNIPLYGIR